MGLGVEGLTLNRRGVFSKPERKSFSWNLCKRKMGPAAHKFVNVGPAG